MRCVLLFMMTFCGCAQMGGYALKEATVTKEHDEYTKSIVLRLNDVQVSGVEGDWNRPMVMRAVAVMDPANQQALFTLHHFSQGWKFLRCHHLNILVDGEPVAPETDFDGDVVHGGEVSENISFHLPVAVFKDVSIVKMRLCNNEMYLKTGQLNTLKHFVKTFEAEQAKTSK